VIHVGDPEGAFVPEPFLDISDQVDFDGERGLLGLALHPDFTNSHRFFINYIGNDGDTVVSEFRRIPGCACADPASERVLLRIEQPFGNHNGGALAFGPDGMLYVSTGDGGSAGDPLDAGQDLATLLGKILRIDVDAAEPYAIPADNPFVGTAGARPEIWAYGLRNPWRISFDRQTGDQFIADVGQERWEEVNAQPAGTGGQNYGWRIMEGPECFDPPQDCDTTGLTMPAAWYPLNAECAVMGGYVFRGPDIPDLVGGYLFADYCSGNVWAIDAALAIRAAQGEAEIPLPIHDLGNAGIAVTGFGEDEVGRLYLVGAGGEVLRVVAAD
jgi:glucose/arabinose dehydrogenase